MNLRKRILAGALATIAILTAACEEEGLTSQPKGNTQTDYSNVGETFWLGYYDLNDETYGAIEMVNLFKERYGGTITSKIVNSTEYYDSLAIMISSNNSPDLVRFEWAAFPHGMSMNQFEPLTQYIDLDSELWAGMKDVIKRYEYNGEIYYPAYQVSGEQFVINYNVDNIAKAGLEDPYELYLKNEWTWDKFREQMQIWVDLDKENHIGYSGMNSMPFIATTGKNLVDVKDGQIINNLTDGDVERIQTFLYDLNKGGLLNGDWAGPDEAMKDGNRLFYGMGRAWAHTSMSRAEPTKKFRFVPYPRDPQADKYYTNASSFGYLVPSGAKNIKGAVAWINLNREEEINPENIAEAREKAINPEPQYYTKGANAGKEKWVLKMEPEMYDLSMDLINPEKFGLVFDISYGFNADLKQIYEYTILNGTMYNGESWTQIREEQNAAIEGILQTYRDQMKK